MGRESGIYGRFRDHRQFDEALTQLAIKQHAVFALDQARTFGLSASAIHKRATGRALIDMTVPGRGTRHHQGLDIRTQLDLAGVIDRRGVEKAFDQAEILDLFDFGRSRINWNETPAAAQPPRCVW